MEEHAFIAKKPCGCLIAVTVDDPKNKRTVNKDISDWTRDGLTVTKHLISEVRAMKFGCKCKTLDSGH